MDEITKKDVKDYYSYDDCVEFLTHLVNICYQDKETQYVGEPSMVESYEFVRKLSKKLSDAKLEKVELGLLNDGISRNELMFVEHLVEHTDLGFVQENMDDPVFGSAIRVCYGGQENKPETEKSIATQNDIDFKELKRLKDKTIISSFYIDDMCLHINIPSRIVYLIWDKEWFDTHAEDIDGSNCFADADVKNLAFSFRAMKLYNN